MADEQELLYFNGIDGDRGAYDLPPMTAGDLAQIIEGGEIPENLNELRFRYQQRTAKHLGVKEGVDATRLDESGWGIIFAHDADAAVKEALSELIALRQEQAGDYFRLYSGADGYRPGESKSEFLARHGAGPGPADPEKVPYYLLIVGSPEAIPYRFQSQLDVQYAVGRIHFDTLQEYANYARTVVAAETGQIRLPRQAAFFGTANADDRATQLSAQHLLAPLYLQLRDSVPDWQFSEFAGEQATKAQLSRLLGGDDTPAFLFSASHGMSFGADSLRQLPHQGALLCQDWPGPQQWHQAIPQDFYFAADDLGGNADLQGLIAFFFACFGAGTPRFDDFARQAFHDQRAEIAPHSFLARLPTAMLGHERGGALATVGHVERAWGYSFLWPGAGAQTTTFESVLRGLLSGYPIGYAVEYLNERYAELSTVLSDELEEVQFGKITDPYELSGMWTANNDARGYAIIGDPAVRLPVIDSDDQQVKRPVVEMITLQPTEASHPNEAPESRVEEAEENEVNASEDEMNPNPSEPLRTPPLPRRLQPGATDGDPSQNQADPSGADGLRSFVPPPSSPGGMTLPAEISNEAYRIWLDLYRDWAEHMKAGYENNDQIFQRILKAFMRSHDSTLVMYWILFAVGIGLFLLAAILVVVQGEMLAGAVFGGLSVAAFLTYFVSRPTQSIEENLEFITWLGIIYSSYWTHQAWQFEGENAQEVLDKATEDAITQIKELIDRHAKAVKERPSFAQRTLERGR